ncbi:MAG TPA: hypothetical protein VGF82_22120 [Terracidiphilus sp.]
MHETLCALFLSTAMLAASQSSSSSEWVGIWQGELDGQPSVTLTVAQDNATLEGTLVLNIITRDGGKPHIVAHEPHTLMHPQVDGVTLSFQLRRIDGTSDPMRFHVEMTSHEKAKIHCLNCGDNAPVVEITKLD